MHTSWASARGLLLASLLLACTRTSAPPRAEPGGQGTSQPSTQPTGQPGADEDRDLGEHDTRLYEVPAALEARVTSGELRSAVFAGGCFWCLETAFEGKNGVVAAISGYSGGQPAHPTYEDVGSGQTGHAESVRVLYDPKVIGYADLLAIFWHNIDPTQANGQFCDRGPQYRSAVFVGNEAERAAAVASRDALVGEGLPGPVVTEIVSVQAFYPAERYHQDFFRKQPEHYHAYREGCGRDRRLRALFGDKAP